MTDFLTFENDGSELLSTNYWQSEHAAKGFVYVSINAGCFRLLVPKGKGIPVEDIKSAEIVLVTKGEWAEMGRSVAMELLFEDHTDNPFCLHLVPEQFASLPADRDRDRPGQLPKWTFAAYNEDGKFFECPARYRKKNKIPFLKPWKD